MYIRGVTDYDKQGSQIETGLYIGDVLRDGELRSGKSGKSYGTSSARAFTKKDGTAAFLGIKGFGKHARAVANLKKGDTVLIAGRISKSEYNGKTYTDMMVDFILVTGKNLLTGKSLTPSPVSVTASDFNDGQQEFAEIDEEDGELPF